MKDQPSISTHFRNSDFKHKMKRLQVPPELVYRTILCTRKKKLKIYEIAAINLSKVYFLKNAKKTCKPNNRD